MDQLDPNRTSWIQFWSFSEAVNHHFTIGVWAVSFKNTILSIFWREHLALLPSSLPYIYYPDKPHPISKCRVKTLVPSWPVGKKKTSLFHPQGDPIDPIDPHGTTIFLGQVMSTHLLAKSPWPQGALGASASCSFTAAFRSNCSSNLATTRHRVRCQEIMGYMI